MFHPPFTVSSRADQRGVVGGRGQGDPSHDGHVPPDPRGRFAPRRHTRHRGRLHLGAQGQVQEKSRER